LTPNGKRLYTTFRANNVGFLAIYDAVTHRRINQLIPTDFFISGIAAAPDGKHVYVANSGNDHTVKVIDTTTDLVTAEVPVDTSIDIAISPDGKRAYTTSFTGVDVIDTVTNTVTATIAIDKGTTTGSLGRDLAITAGGTTGYLTNGGDNSISVLDLTANTEVARVDDVGADPVGIALSPDGTQIFVCNHGDDTFTVIDAGGQTITEIFQPGAKPFRVAVTPDGAYAYVTFTGDDDVKVLDIAEKEFVATIAVGDQPFALAISA
jgi:YVTN family beta-propeller protein